MRTYSTKINPHQIKDEYTNHTSYILGGIGGKSEGFLRQKTLPDVVGNTYIRFDGSCVCTVLRCFFSPYYITRWYKVSLFLTVLLRLVRFRMMLTKQLVIENWLRIKRKKKINAKMVSDNYSIYNSKITVIQELFFKRKFSNLSHIFIF